MRKILAILFAALICFPYSMQAGIYGTLKGKVVDEEGKPIIGATIRIIGTTRGAIVKNPDGKFSIVNIDPGKYTVKVTFVGKEPYIAEEVKISADDITFLDITMREKGVRTKEVTVYGSKMVSNYSIGNVNKVSEEEMQTVAREGISSVISTTAGVVSSGGGYSIRGSRASDTQIRIDGINATNQFTGGGAALPSITEYDTEEIQVLTGGFSAEYGEVMGGVVNTIMKRGRTDKYEGYVRYRTDVPFMFGSQASGKDLVYDETRDAFKAVESGDGANLQGPGQHRFSFGTGGPMPYLDGSTFYISSNYTYRKWNGASFEIRDPIGNNLGRMPDQQSWDKNIAARLRFKIAKGVELNFGGKYGSQSWENSSWSWLYADQEGWEYDLKTGQPKLDGNGNPITNGIPERMIKQVVGNNFNSNFFVRLNHTLDPTSFYELTVSNSMIEEEYSKRKDDNDPGYFAGFDIWYPQDNYGVSGSNLVEGEPNKIVDQYEIIKKTVRTADGYGVADYTQRNPLTGYIEGSGDATPTSNPFGRQNSFYEHGNSRTLDFRRSNIWSIDGKYEKSLRGTEFEHMIKGGFDFKYFTLERHMNSLPWDGNPFFDVYTEEWGGNFYTFDQQAWEETSEPYHPMKIAAYALDQISYKGIIISPGLRFDMFMPQARYRTNLDQFVSITADSGFGDAQAKYQISPRINVTYPLTERSNISLNYGLFFQMPVLSSLYDGFATIRLRGNQVLGNPNMDAQRTNQYEVNYNNQLTDILALNVSAYYKDIYNQLGQVYVPAIPLPYFQYSVSEYGNIKGVEFTLRKRPTRQDHIQMRLNYTLSQSRATSSSPGDNYMRPIDPYTDLIAFPLSEYPTANDIRHRADFILSFIWANNQGFSIGGIQPLENLNLNFTTTWRSGVPYTKTDLSGRAIGELRTERGPSYWKTDMRLSKSFYLRDWLGESMGNSQIELALFVYNVFNLNEAIGLYTSTGDPDDRGMAFRRKAGDFSSIPFYEEADFSNVNTFNSTQYDNFGKRLYSKYADADGNGVVNQQEKFDSYIRQLETSVQFQGNYQTPRSVFFTVYFKF